jgi:type IV pilus assembly protein PilX
MRIHRAASDSRSTAIGRAPRFGSASREGGFSLIVALMMLIVIILLGVSGSQMAINEERGSRNDRDRQLAFQAAEAAIKDAETEIYGSASLVCNLPGLQSHGKMRSASGIYTCFNQDYIVGYVSGCSSPPNAGLCLNNPSTPAYLDSTNVDFLKDASGAGNNHTVVYGQYTGRSFASQATSGFSAQPISAYPPRYIIEAIPKNTSVDSTTAGACSGLPCMFRITAIGFGANPNSQVVLQAVVATQD